MAKSKLGRKAWTKKEWEFCKSIIKLYSSEDKVVSAHNAGGYNRTIDAIKSMVHKRRHNEIILVKFQLDRGFTAFEREALFTYMIDNELTYHDVINNINCAKQIANFFMRTPQKIRHEVRKNVRMLNNMYKERFESQQHEGLFNAPTGEVKTIHQPKQQCNDNNHSSPSNPFTQTSDENDEMCQPQTTKTIHANKNTPIEKQFGKQLTVLDTINEKENRLQAILIKLNPTLSKSSVLGTVCKFLVKCKGLQISDGKNGPIITLCDTE